MTTFFVGAGELEYAGPPSVYVDGAVGSPDREPVQASMPLSLAPTQHAPTPSTNYVERLEKKIDDLHSEVGHLTAMVHAIMQHLSVEVSGQVVIVCIFYCNLKLRMMVVIVIGIVNVNVIVI